MLIEGACEPPMLVETAEQIDQSIAGATGMRSVARVVATRPDRSRANLVAGERPFAFE